MKVFDSWLKPERVSGWGGISGEYQLLSRGGTELYNDMNKYVTTDTGSISADSTGWCFLSKREYILTMYENSGLLVLIRLQCKKRLWRSPFCRREGRHMFLIIYLRAAQILNCQLKWLKPDSVGFLRQFDYFHEVKKHLTNISEYEGTSDCIDDYCW